MKKITLYLICTLAFFISGCAAMKNGERKMEKGAILFTFDDCDVNGWTNSIELFKRYNAHATFFFSGRIEDEQIECMKKLQAAGHSIGLHSLTHKDAPEFIEKNGTDAYWKQEIEPQLSAVKQAGLSIKNFAFPNNLYNDASIALLQREFKRFRAGCGAKLTEPETQEYANAFFPVSELAGKTVFGGFGVGEYYKTKQEDLLSAIDKAARENKVLVIFSHAIAPEAKGVNMPLEYLTAALEHADSLGMKILGFDDIEKEK